MAINPIDMKKCVRCGMCEMFCPMDVIRFDKTNKEPVITYIEDCMLCGLCEFRCPAKAIVVTPEKHAKPILCWR